MNKSIEWQPTPELNEDLVKMQLSLVNPLKQSKVTLDHTQGLMTLTVQ
ncbi:hypothetical protein ABU186_08430 [Weissella paramesenteroides]